MNFYKGFASFSLAVVLVFSSFPASMVLGQEASGGVVDIGGFVADISVSDVTNSDPQDDGSTDLSTAAGSVDLGDLEGADTQIGDLTNLDSTVAADSADNNGSSNDVSEAVGGDSSQSSSDLDNTLLSSLNTSLNIGGTAGDNTSVTVVDENLLGHSCLIPNSRGDTDVEGIMFGWDGYSLEKNFNDLGINKSIISDQKQYQEWEMLSSGTTTIKVEYLSKNGVLNHTFGYYIVAGGVNINPIFNSGQNSYYPDTNILPVGGSSIVEIKGPTRIGFSISTSDGKNYYTHNAKNEYQNDHAVVYELEKNVYIISFEDLPLGENGISQESDRDYNDIIVKVTVLGCDSITPPPPPPLPICKASLDVILTLDISGSMQGEPLEDAKEASNLFINNLSSTTDKVGVVVYSDYSKIKSSLTSNFAAAKASYANAVAGGSTNIGLGLSTSASEFTAHARGGSVKKVLVMLSDGKANRPTDEVVAAAYAREQATIAKSQGIIIYTIGLGSAIDEALLKDIASADSFYYKAPSSSDLANIYKLVAETECVREPSSVSGKVIDDKNGNAAIDQGEEGIPNWTVILESISDQGVKLTATTTSTGDFTFNDVAPGEYKLCQNLKSNWQQIYPEPNTNGGCFALTIVFNQDVLGKNFLNKAVVVPPLEPAVTLTGNPSTIVVGSTTTLTWSSTNTNLCSAVWTSATSTFGSEILSPATTTEYSITCTGDGGSKTASTTITVTPKSEHPKPTVTLTANPGTITRGGSSTLNWGSSNTTYCTASWTSATSTFGSQTVSPSQTEQYSISCGGQYGTSTASATIIVNPSQNNGGGGGSFSGSRRHPVVSGEVLGATSCTYLRDYLKIDWNNDPVEVLKLQFFLNKFEGENLSFTGVFDEMTFRAVERFQNKYFDDILKPWGHTAPTGFVYITTKKKINEIYCNTTINLSVEDQNEISAFRAYIESLGGNLDTLEGVQIGRNTSGAVGISELSGISGRGVSLGDLEVSATASPVVNLESGPQKSESRVVNVGRNLAISLFSLPQKIFNDWSNTIAVLILLAVIIMAVRILGFSKKENVQRETSKSEENVSEANNSPVIILPGTSSKEDKNTPSDEEIIINEDEEEEVV